MIFLVGSRGLMGRLRSNDTEVVSCATDPRLALVLAFLRSRLVELSEQLSEVRIVADRREVGIGLEADDVGPTAVLTFTQAIERGARVAPGQLCIKAGGGRGESKSAGGLEIKMFIFRWSRHQLRGDPRPRRAHRNGPARP